MTKAVAEVRDLAGIEYIDDETGERRKKHLHDARGTFATKLMLQTDLTDLEIAEIMGWVPQEVAFEKSMLTSGPLSWQSANASPVV